MRRGGAQGRRAVGMPPDPDGRAPFAGRVARREPGLGPWPRFARRRIAQRPDPRALAHFGQVGQARASHPIQEAAVPPVPFVTGEPARPQSAGHRRLDHPASELRLTGERRVLWNAAGVPALSVVCGKPFLGEVQATVEEGVALPAGVAQEDAGLAEVGLAGGTAPLARRPGRVVAALGDIAPVHDEHAVVFAQRLVHQPPMLGQDGVVVPASFTDELLQRSHAPLRPVVGAQEAQRHGLCVLARDIGDEQTPEIDGGPGTLLAAPKERREVGVVGRQLLRQRLYLDHRDRLRAGRLRQEVADLPSFRYHRHPPLSLSSRHLPYHTMSRCRTS